MTSIAVTAKFSSEGSLIFVSRLKDASPVQSATVQLYQGKKLAWKGQTDKSGIARTPDYEKLGIKPVGYETPLIAFVTAGEDVAYTTSKWDDGIQPYRFDIPFASGSEEQSLTGTLFTERGIYRTGETVFIKGVLREKKDGSLIVPKQKKYFLTIRNSRDEKVLRKSVQIDQSFASFSDSLKLPSTVSLGYYSISLSKDTASNYNNIADQSFRVEAYRPATFAVTVKTDQPNYISGGSLKSTIEGRYLFGAAMSEDKVRWSLQRTKIPDFGFKGYDGYFWQMLDWNREEATGSSNLIASGSGKLTREGLFTLSQKLDLKIEEPSFLTVEAEVTDPSRQAIAGRTAARIHPASFYIGLKPQATFTKQNSPLPIDIVTLTPDAKAVSKTITIEVVHRQWISVKRGGVGGRYEWVSEKVDSIISRKELQTDKSGHASLAPKLSEAGLYFIRANAKDEHGNIARSETYTYVYGNSYVAWERFDDDRIEITPNKKSYKPGETANILI
ncbi:MAG: hypothetical protein HGA87_07055, partial [Desulfobulbaceae bacterium]|nr:hypothetical protein [Desulfobulbaceae bacterium]